MILKNRKIPLRILQGEAILRNISPTCPARQSLETDCAKRKAGYWGETELDYYLKLLPHDDYFILNDLRLPFMSNFFQIDSVIITKRYIILIESKSIKGILYFDKVFNQLIRLKDDIEEAFEDPIAQVKTHILKLKSLFPTLLKNVPTDYLVSIANTKTIIKSNSNHIDRVSHAYNIVHLLMELDAQYKVEFLTTDQVLDVANRLIELHTPSPLKSLQTLGFSKRDFPPGIHCPNCNRKLDYYWGKWTCATCQTTSRKIYIQKIIDYFLIFGRGITNSQCKEFLDLPSDNRSFIILNKLNLPSTGNRKKKYIIRLIP